MNHAEYSFISGPLENSSNKGINVPLLINNKKGWTSKKRLRRIRRENGRNEYFIPLVVREKWMSYFGHNNMNLWRDLSFVAAENTYLNPWSDFLRLIHKKVSAQFQIFNFAANSGRNSTCMALYGQDFRQGGA